MKGFIRKIASVILLGNSIASIGLINLDVLTNQTLPILINGEVSRIDLLGIIDPNLTDFPTLKGNITFELYQPVSKEHKISQESLNLLDRLEPGLSRLPTPRKKLGFTKPLKRCRPLSKANQKQKKSVEDEQTAVFEFFWHFQPYSEFSYNFDPNTTFVTVERSINFQTNLIRLFDQTTSECYSTPLTNPKTLRFKVDGIEKCKKLINVAYPIWQENANFTQDKEYFTVTNFFTGLRVEDQKIKILALQDSVEDSGLMISIPEMFMENELMSTRRSSVEISMLNLSKTSHSLC